MNPVVTKLIEARRELDRQKQEIRALEKEAWGRFDEVRSLAARDPMVVEVVKLFLDYRPLKYSPQVQEVLMDVAPSLVAAIICLGVPAGLGGDEP